MIPVQRQRICSIQITLVCARREFKLYLCHTSQVSFVCVCEDAAGCDVVQIRELMFQSKVNVN